MYRVLIVDDEPLVAANIRAALEEVRDRFPVEAVAGSGREALRLIEERRPDIVITDILMPGMTGIDLIRACGSRFPGTRFVIVSGHAEFEYARAAMECGAVAYCLKPLQDEELQQAVSRAAESLRDRRDPGAELLEALADPESRKNRLDGYFPEPGAYWVLTAVGGDLPLGEIPAHVVRTGTRERLLLIPAVSRRAGEGALAAWDHTSGEKRLSIGSAGLAENVEELNRAMRIARSAAYSFFTVGRQGYYPARSDSEEGLCRELLRGVEDALSHRDAAAAETIFSRLEEQFSMGAAGIEKAMLCCNAVYYFLSREGDTEGGYVSGCESLVRRYRDAGEMCRELCRQCLRFIAGVQKSIRVEEKTVRNETIRAVVTYLNGNFWKDLNIQSIADRFFVNMSYLCQVFKRETGHTMLEYISTLRIEQACALIRNSDFSVSEICEKVGYGDYCHFNKVFRRIMGKSPLQYSREVKNRN